jgi:hypothetical protein
MQPFVFDERCFPMEIIVHIFRLAAQSSRTTCPSLCLVASWVRELTLPYLYRRVITLHAGSTDLFFNGVSKNPTVGYMVDSLCLSERERPGPSHITLCCPNLRSVIGHSPGMHLLNIQSINRVGIIVEEGLELGYVATVMTFMILPSLLRPRLHQFVLIYHNDSDMERMLDGLKQGRAITPKLAWVAINEEDGRSLQAMWDGHHPQGNSIWEIAEARTKAMVSPPPNTRTEGSGTSNISSETSNIHENSPVDILNGVPVLS